MVTYSITTYSKLRSALAGGARPVDLAGPRATLLGCILMCAAGALALPGSAMAQTCPAASPLDQAPKPPEDLCGAVAVTDEVGFHELSWQLFKYLVWPATPGKRGEPDAARKVFDMAGPRVFETFKADWEVLRQNAEDPGDWNAHPSSPCSNHQEISPGALVLASTSKFGNLSVGRRSDSAHVLIAQNGTYVRYQIGYNDKLFDSIKRNKLYDLREVRDLANALPDAEIDRRARAPNGAIVLKSAWLELPPANAAAAPDGSSKFYVRDDAWVQVPGTNDCRRTRVGLVGLHIVYKTLDRPQWIWSTFEHVDNVPEAGDPAGKRYTFNNGDRNVAMEPDPGEAYLVSAQQPGQVPPPYQVERRQKISVDANQKNLEWQAKLKQQQDSVWQNYKLVTSQWLIPRRLPGESIANHQIAPSCGSNPATANVTMETFQQVCTKETTCLGCHNLARTTDHVFSIRLNPHAPPAFDVRVSRDEIVKKVEDVLKSVK